MTMKVSDEFKKMYQEELQKLVPFAHTIEMKVRDVDGLLVKLTLIWKEKDGTILCSRDMPPIVVGESIVIYEPSKPILFEVTVE